MLMGSLTVFRTLCVAEERKRSRERSGGGGEGGSGRLGKGGTGRPRLWYTLGYYRVRGLAGWEVMRDGNVEGERGLPEIPGAVMTGLKTFVIRNNR